MNALIARLGAWVRTPSHASQRTWLGVALMAGVLAGCANPAIKLADDLSQAGQYEAAYVALDRAHRENPNDVSITLAKAKQRDTTTAFLIYQAQSAYAAGAIDETRALLARIDAVSPKDPRTAGLYAALDRLPRHKKLMAQAQADYDRGQYDRAADALHTVVNEDGGNMTARTLLARVDEQREAQVATMASSLKTADKIINLEFREAPLRTVFEALARAADVNFVFDKDVRNEAKVSLFLRNTTVDEAMRVILSTQQLDRKLLNDNSVLIYPNNAQKQREHQDLVTRSFYLVNADAKQAQNLIRTMTKTRDIFVDERLNLMVVRDTPEVIRVVERLIESIDLPESEVMLEVEIMEVSSKTVRELGLSWPVSASYGVPGSTAPIVTGTDGLRAFVANPLVKATLSGSSGSSNLLANPKIRARNHEKAKVQIGQKLPVFTTTSTANVGTATSVTYLDVGLKLEVEPSIQLDGDVIMKVALEVSSNNGEVKSADGTTAYLIGNRVTSTSLRLKDGETQVLAGLIQDDDRRNAAGIPGLSEVQGLGVLFGTRKTDREKTEIVLLITPRIVRSTTLPALAGSAVPSGTDTQPGAASMRIRPGKPQVSGQAGGGGGMSSNLALGQRGAGTFDQGRGAGAAAVTSPNEPSIGGPEEVLAGAAFNVTINNPLNSPISTDLLYDPSVFKAGAPGAQGGRVPLQIPPKGTSAVTLTVLPQASDTTTTLSLTASNNTLSIRLRGANSTGSAHPEGDEPPPPQRQD